MDQHFISSSSKNSVSFCSQETGVGFQVIRNADGTKVVKETTFAKENTPIKYLIKILIVCTIFRELSSFSFLPQFFFHIPTIAIILLWAASIIHDFPDKEACMYHGAEHMVRKWYKGIQMGSQKKLEEYSRIHRFCSTNLLCTIVTFQFVSSISMNIWNFHIPELITFGMPFLVYNIIPFNIFGIVSQIFFTTKKPTPEHLALAREAWEYTLNDR